MVWHILCELFNSIDPDSIHGVWSLFATIHDNQMTLQSMKIKLTILTIQYWNTATIR